MQLNDSYHHKDATPIFKSDRIMENQNFASIYLDAHKTRLRGLDAIYLLCQLIRKLQQHRGASLAVLAGDTIFESRLHALQGPIYENMAKIQNEGVGLIDQCRWAQIVSEWFTVKRQWRKDSVVQNFELHSHVITQINDLIWQVAKNSDPRIESDPILKELGQYLFRGVLDVIEILGKLRGLSTHVAVLGECETDFGLRISFLRRQLDTASANSHAQLQSLPTRFKDPLLLRIGSYRCHAIERSLCAMIDQDIIGKGPVKATSDQVFGLATQAIDAYVAVLTTGLQMMRTELDDNLKMWVEKRVMPAQ